MRLHLSCGDIYLKDYMNVDVVGDIVPLDYRKKHGTTVDNYYTKPFSQVFEERGRSKFKLDAYMNLLEEWALGREVLEEVLFISAFEHFTKPEIKHILTEVYHTLKLGGQFRFDFPDLKEIVRKYLDDAPEYAMELIYCNHKNEYSIHKWGYTEKSIQNLFKEYFDDKFKLTFGEIVKHDYPMIGCTAIKVK